ncbi:hypothetical protein U1Q18_025145 [Sarracenia purpurea var. burkii]
MSFPPLPVSHIAHKFMQYIRIPVTIVVSEAQRWLHPQIMDHIKNQRLSSKNPSFCLLLDFVVCVPDMFQEVHVFWNPMPPGEDLVQISLISVTVGLNLVDLIH